MKYNTWVEISKNTLFNNINQYCSVIGTELPFAPVIKSNAYGHGMLVIAHLCQENTAVDWLCVALLSEAVQLRIAGITKPILVLSIIDDELEQIVKHAINVVAYDMHFIMALQKVAVKHKQNVSIHIKIDTGLSRAGLLYTEALSVIKKIYALPYITINGIFTHFANSESTDQTFMNLQIDRFGQLINNLNKLGIYIPYKHSSCSAALTTNNNSFFSFARAGIGIYGLWPSPENKKITQQKHPQFTLQPIMTWKTKIIQIKKIPAGSCVGYDLTYCVNKQITVALLPIGYWDGYDRKLSNCGLVKIDNYYASVIGRVAMNLTIIDITQIPNAQIGDEVELLGLDQNISAEAMAQKIGTINYEVVTRINPLIPRIIVD